MRYKIIIFFLLSNFIFSNSSCDKFNSLEFRNIMLKKIGNKNEINLPMTFSLFPIKECGFPSWLNENKHTKRVNLSFNTLTTIPEFIYDFADLNELCLIANDITNISNKIEKFQKLKKLYMGNNKILQLPSEISKLKYLEELDLSKNKLRNLPKEIIQLKNLKFLYLDDNKDLTLTDEQKDWIKFLVEKNNCDVKIDINIE